MAAMVWATGCRRGARQRRAGAVTGAAVGLVAAALAGALGSAATAEWRVCNQSSFILQAAVGHEESGELWSEGWLRMRPGECTVAIDGDLEPGTYFLYARSSAAHRGGRREWSGSRPLCVDEAESSFFLSSSGTCEAVGAATRLFSPIDVQEASWRTRLMEPSTPGRGYSVGRARTLGLQRLLADAGYYAANRIDGVAGRRTERAVARFLGDMGQRAEPPYEELLDLLEKTAVERKDDAGLTVCNRANAPIWSAVATRVERSWESRGWWELAPDQCATIIDKALDEPPYYLYADKQDERGPRPLKDGAETFCLAQTRFAILGRDECRQRGFDEGRFMSVEPDGAGAAMIEFETDDFAEPVRLDAP